VDATTAANGEHFGAPLPLISSGVATCVDNAFDTTPKVQDGTGNITTGELTAQLNLTSKVYLTSAAAICPRCSGPGLGKSGTCQGGRNNGQACTTEGVVRVSGSTYNLSSACQPEGNPIGALSIPLALTTGTASKTAPNACPGQTRNNNCGGGSDGPCNTTSCPAPSAGITQNCCDSDPSRSCFPATGNITRTGSTTVPEPVDSSAPFPKRNSPDLGGVFCIAATSSTVVNGVAGLPGTGAIIMSVDTCWYQ
jgi:hypothetical protein